MAFYFSGHPNFAANQSVTVMEIITFESKAYKELDNKITAIADYIFNHMETARQSEEDMWVDSYEVCTRPAARTGRSNHRICRPLQIERAEKRVSDTCRRAAQTHANRRT